MTSRKAHTVVRDERTYIRVSADEKLQLAELASKSDCSTMSEYVRNVSLGYPVKSVVTHEAINELRRLGGLVKHLFIEGERQDPGGMYLETLQELQAAIRRLGREQ
ncbi:mobilization protein [Halomonas litopenaei]|nr:mobilization protein [Halomonas litopenaei]